MDSAESVELVRSFIAACVRADPDEVGNYLSEEAEWWNSPWEPVKGREAIREIFRRAAVGTMKALPWEIRHIAAAKDVVFTERVDIFQIGDTQIRVPCMGIFELHEGKIVAWRDYWDSKQFERQLPK
jgi:limonene-1,2-epoxide hydrolase